MRYRDSSVPKMRVKILALIMLGLLLTAPFTQMAWGASVESGAGESSDDSADKGSSEVTETVFNSIKLAAEARRDEVLSKINEDLPLSVLSDICEALTLMEKAEGSEATTSEATQLYMQAMKLFRDSWNYIDDDAHMPTGEASGNDEPVLVDKQNENLNEEILIAKQQLLLRFKENFQSRIVTMYGHIKDLGEAMDPEDSAKAENALVSAEEKLLEVQKNVTDGNLEDALIRLDDTSKGLEDEFKSLKDKEAADLIVTVDKLEGKVQKLTEENTRLSGENGSDAPEDTNDKPKVIEEPVRDEPKEDSGVSQGSSSESKGNSNSQKDNYQSTEDYINDLKERIHKSLEEFRAKRIQEQASDDDDNEKSNNSRKDLTKDEDDDRSDRNKNDLKRSNYNRNSNGNGSGNSAENGSGNAAENGNGNSAENGSGNSAENGSGNAAENGNGNAAENGNGNSAENSNGNAEKSKNS